MTFGDRRVVRWFFGGRFVASLEDDHPRGGLPKRRPNQNENARELLRFELRACTTAAVPGHKVMAPPRSAPFSAISPSRPRPPTRQARRGDARSRLDDLRRRPPTHRPAPKLADSQPGSVIGRCVETHRVGEGDAGCTGSRVPAVGRGRLDRSLCSAGQQSTAARRAWQASTMRTGSSEQTRSTRYAFGTTLRLSKEAAHSVGRPSSTLRRTSVGMPRTVRVIGAANRL